MQIAHRHVLRLVHDCSPVVARAILFSRLAIHTRTHGSVVSKCMIFFSRLLRLRANGMVCVRECQCGAVRRCACACYIEQDERNIVEEQRCNKYDRISNAISPSLSMYLLNVLSLLFIK